MSEEGFARKQRNPQSEMGVLAHNLFGDGKYSKTPINKVVPSGHLSKEQMEYQHMLHDLYSEIKHLTGELDIKDDRLSITGKILEKIASISHFSKAEDGFAAEMLITRRSQQFQAMKQKNEVDTGPSLKEELAKELQGRGESTDIAGGIDAPDTADW